MAEINWGILPQGGTQNALATGLQLGGQIRQAQDKRKIRNAIGTIFGPTAPTGTPGIGDGIPGNKRMDGTTAPDPQGQAWNDLLDVDPKLALTLRSQHMETQQKQQEQRLKGTEQLGRLLNHAQDEASYQQALSAAKQIGIDTAGAPPNFDPNWVNRQKAVLAAFDKDGGSQISGLARELNDAGYKSGTPEFEQAMRTALQGKYAPTYTDEKGNMRQGQLPALPSRAQPRIISQRPAGLTDEQLFAQAHEAVRNGANVEEVFRQLQAWGVNP